MKRNVLAVAAAAVIAGLPIAAALAGVAGEDARTTRGQSVTGDAGSDSATADPTATTETSAATPGAPPPPISVPTSGGDDDDDDDHDHSDDD